MLTTLKDFLYERRHVKLMYHGSGTLVEDKLRPHASRVLDLEKAVFATPDKWLALVFIPKWSDDNLELSIVDGRGELKERRKDAFDVLDCTSYLYSVAASHFESDDRLGMQGSEFVCPKAVPILHTEFVYNVRHVLEKLPGKLIKHKHSK